MATSRVQRYSCGTKSAVGEMEKGPASSLTLQIEAYSLAQ